MKLVTLLFATITLLTVVACGDDQADAPTPAATITPLSTPAVPIATVAPRSATLIAPAPTHTPLPAPTAPIAAVAAVAPNTPTPLVVAVAPITPTPAVVAVAPNSPTPTVAAVAPNTPTPLVVAVAPNTPTPLVVAVAPITPTPMVAAVTPITPTPFPVPSPFQLQRTLPQARQLHLPRLLKHLSLRLPIHLLLLQRWFLLLLRLEVPLQLQRRFLLLLRLRKSHSYPYSNAGSYCYCDSGSHSYPYSNAGSYCLLPTPTITPEPTPSVNPALAGYSPLMIEAVSSYPAKFDFVSDGLTSQEKNVLDWADSRLFSNESFLESKYSPNNWPSDVKLASVQAIPLLMNAIDIQKKSDGKHVINWEVGQPRPDTGRVGCI